MTLIYISGIMTHRAFIDVFLYFLRLLTVIIYKYLRYIYRQCTSITIGKYNIVLMRLLFCFE